MSSALTNVLFIGGPPGVGKTTVASILARRHGLRLYSADTRTWVHRDRAIAAGVKAAIRWESLSRQERTAASDGDLLAMSLHRERGPMVISDLLELPRTPLIVAEGSVIRPGDLPTGVSAVWLVSDAAEQGRRLVARDGRSLRLYELLLEVISVEIDAARAPIIRVGTIAGTAAALENFFAPLLAAGPLATTVESRRALLREANLDIVEQVRGYHRRPWAVGDADSVVRDFACECGDRSCEMFVAAAVADASREPVFELLHHPLRA